MSNPTFNTDRANIESGFRDRGFGGDDAAALADEWYKQWGVASGTLDADNSGRLGDDEWSMQGAFNAIANDSRSFLDQTGAFSKAKGSLVLDKFEGETDVPLSAGDQELMSLVRNLVSGETGGFRDALSGDPSLGHAESLINIGKTQLRENVLPQVRDVFSGSPLGSGFNTGARREAEEKAILNNFEQNQQIRAQAFQQATQDQFQAMGMLPGMANVLAQERTNEIMNKERELMTHYKNQGLSVSEFQGDMQVAQLSLQEDMFEFQQDQFRTQLKQMEEAKDQAANAGLFGTFGAILGAGLGSFAGPMGMSLGSQLGGGLGLLGAGESGAGFQTISQVPQQYAQYNLMQDLFNPGTVKSKASPDTVLNTPADFAANPF